MIQYESFGFSMKKEGFIFMRFAVFMALKLWVVVFQVVIP
jgi:hypothetical protein